MATLAMVSYQWIETPIRHAKWLSGQKRPFGFGLLVAAGSAVVPFGLMVWPGGRPLFAGDVKLEMLHGNLSESQPAIKGDCMWWMGKGPKPEDAARLCTIHSAKGGHQQRFFVMGDSLTGNFDDWLTHIPNRQGLWARKAFAGGQSVLLVENRWEGALSARAKDASQQKRLLALTLSELQKGDVLLSYTLQQFQTKEQRLSPGFTPGISRWQAWLRDLD